MRGLFLMIGTILTSVNLALLVNWIRERNQFMFTVQAAGLAASIFIIVTWV